MSKLWLAENINMNTSTKHVGLGSVERKREREREKDRPREREIERERERLRGRESAKRFTVAMEAYNQPYFEKRNGDWFCLLCEKWAPHSHITSRKHNNKAWYYQRYPQSRLQLDATFEAIPRNAKDIIQNLGRAPCRGTLGSVPICW